MVDINLWIVIPACLAVFVLWVGFYIFMFLTVMRVDPREQEFREDTSQTNTLLPRDKK